MSEAFFLDETGTYRVVQNQFLDEGAVVRTLDDNFLDQVAAETQVFFDTPPGVPTAPIAGFDKLYHSGDLRVFLGTDKRVFKG